MTLIRYLDQFPMEKLSLSLQNIPLSFLILGLVEFIFFLISMNWVERVCKYFSRFFKSILSQNVELSNSSRERVGKIKHDPSKFSNRKARYSEKVDDRSIHREDMEFVMGRLGIFCHPREHAKHLERFGLDYFASLFEESEPSLDELKIAFDVFDKNRDGFIDAVELQTVLNALGLNDRSQTENCEKMISVFDENKDGKIDFREFVKLMEKSCC